MVSEYIPHPEDWPHQTFAVCEGVRMINEGARRFCVTSPCGGGKSRIMQRYCEHGIENGQTTIVMSNRKVLTKQLLNGFDKAGIEVGCRAAEFEARSNPSAMVQIVSAQTEASRVLDVREKYFRDIEFHRGDQLIIDEAHIQRGPRTVEIIDEYVEKFGAVVIGISATPLGIGKIYRDGLIVAGNNSELRDCGALVWANRFEPWTMDLKKVYKEPTGFTQASGEKEARKIWTQHIVAGVYQSWKKLNPDGRPSIGMAPGVPESLGIAQEYWKRGVNAAHIDAKGIFVNGEYYKTRNTDDRDDVFAMVKDGRVPQVWNRFTLREGVDIPELYCLQLATPIASLTSAVQVFGRPLRACQGKKIARIIDHCGVMDLHGSPNADRDAEWKRFFSNDDTDAITKERIERMTDPNNNEPQPITCPECGAKRDKGPKCLACGFEHAQSTRKIIQESGELRQVKGDTYKKRRVAMKPNTEQLWIQTYFRMKKAKVPKSFKQALALFKRENFYNPPDNLPFMPKNKADLTRKIPDVAMTDLYTREPK